MSAESKEIVANLERIRERIERVASRAGRRADKITLIAVSKTVPGGRIREAYEAGVRHFGENRVQERESKFASTADLDATWHLIGNLQSNKVAKAVRLFRSVDSLDRIALAERLERGRKDFNTDDTGDTEGTEKSEKAKAADREERLRVLIEVRLDPAGAKSGVNSEELPNLVDAVLRMPHLELRGLMGVPPYFDDVEEVRPYFRRLRELRDAARARHGAEVLPVLSMGMSHDFEVAIEEGATEVRIGMALFGARGLA